MWEKDAIEIIDILRRCAGKCVIARMSRHVLL
jgi:hypothetical protein